MDRAHGRWRKVWVVFNGDCLLNVVLADVLVHLLHSQRLPVLQNTAVRLLLNTFIKHASLGLDVVCCISFYYNYKL